MFLRKGKSESPLEGEQSPQENDAAEMEKPAGDTAEEKDPLVNQITNLEGLVNKRTKDLEEARNQLSELHETTESSDGDDAKDELPVEDLFTQPNQVKSEPSAVSEKEQPVESKDTESLMGKTNVEEGEPEEKAKDDAMPDFFSSDDDEENPLAGLIGSLPEVTTQELVEEAKQVTTMLREWQENQ
jgi:hypothetical protein